MGSGLEGFDFSHKGVKWVVGLFTGFISVIASTRHCFLYLNQRIHDDKKEKRKKKKKRSLISLMLYATWYFFPDSCASEYNVFHSDIQDPRQEPTNPDPDLPLRDQP